MEPNFVADARAAYRFLEDRYGFEAVASNEDTARPYFGGLVIYSTDKTIVSIQVDRGVLLDPRIGRTQDRGRNELIGEVPLRLVLEFVVASPQERRLLTSYDPIEFRQGLAAFGGLNPLRGNRELAGSQSDMREHIRSQLGSDAKSLEKYAEEFLLGDFSRWRQLHEYKLHRAVAEQLASAQSRGKSPSVPEVEAKFRRSIDYLRALQHE